MERLYTIPVNEAFDKDVECPICEMYDELQSNAIDFVMGPSYMEDDVRLETNKKGFCEKHVRLMYKKQNRLGLSLILLTHMDEVIKGAGKAAKGGGRSGGGLFGRKNQGNALVEYMDGIEGSCYVCDRIGGMFGRYVATVFHLYDTDTDFVRKFKNSKGFCNKHYATLYEGAQGGLRGSTLNGFINDINKLYMDNMVRVRDDLQWFADKFDYRNANEPWKNSKDALPRSMRKVNGIMPE